MGAVRDRMAVDLRLRGLSPVTQRMYLRCAERFVAHHRKSPMTVGEAEIRSFLDHLVREKRVSRSTQRVYVAAIHFLYRVTLDRPVAVRRIPFPRRDGERLPEILSTAEVARLIEAVRRPKHRAMLMTIYGAGLHHRPRLPREPPGRHVSSGEKLRSLGGANVLGADGRWGAGAAA